MAQRTLRCAIEEVAQWHPQLFLEPYVVTGVAVLSRYSPSPAVFEVACENVVSRLLGKATSFTLEVAWQEETAAKAERLRATMQAKPLVEFASVALALVLGHRVVRLGRLEVTGYGDRADYGSVSLAKVLEISGTEALSELGRRHREKVAQATANPLGWDAYVVVCAFSAEGHRIRFSGHRAKETVRGEEG